MSISNVNIFKESEEEKDDSLSAISQFKLFHNEYFNSSFVHKEFPEFDEQDKPKENKFILCEKSPEYDAMESLIISSKEEESDSIQSKANSFNSPNISNESSDRQINILLPTKTERPLFQTEISDEIIQKGQQEKLLMNRLSARKSRLKKKLHIKNMEEELAQLKNNIQLSNGFNFTSSELNNRESEKFFKHITLLQRQEKEVKNEGQKKKQNIMHQYEVLQRQTLTELLIKQIYFMLPLRYKIFGEKYIKLINVLDDDSLSVINTKIDENISRINKYLEVVSDKRKRSVIKLYEIYKNIKLHVINYQELLSKNFNN